MSKPSLNTIMAGKSLRNDVLLFIIWPAIGVFHAFKNYRADWAKDFFLLFCVFFGYTFIIGEPGETDSSYYAGLFVHFAHSNISFKDLWMSFYQIGSGYEDIASPLVSFLVSRISDNPSVLFAIFGLIFGFFYSRNVWYILNRLEGKLDGFTLLFLVTFLLLNPIWNINGFRFFVAAHIFLYGTLPYLIEKNHKKLVWAFASVFFHFSFFFAIAILLLYFILGNRKNIYLGFFIFSALLNEINIDYVHTILYYLPDIFYSNLVNYTNPEYIEGLGIARQSLNWYVTFSYTGIKWVMYAAIGYFFLFERQALRENDDLSSLLSFSLLIYGFANIIDFLPSGGRFVIVANTFLVPFIILFLSRISLSKVSIVLKLFSLPLLLLFCLFKLRGGIDFFSYITVIGNPLTALISADQVALVDWLKNLL